MILELSLVAILGVIIISLIGDVVKLRRLNRAVSAERSLGSAEVLVGKWLPRRLFGLLKLNEMDELVQLHYAAHGVLRTAKMEHEVAEVYRGLSSSIVRYNEASSLELQKEDLRKVVDEKTFNEAVAKMRRLVAELRERGVILDFGLKSHEVKIAVEIGGKKDDHKER